MTRRQRRTVLIGSALAVLGVAVALVLVALRDTIVFFQTPSDIAAKSMPAGQRFRRQSGVDAHHDQVRFAWDLADDDGAVTVAGVDVGVVADDGRLVSITGFFGDPPENGQA